MKTHSVFSLLAAFALLILSSASQAQAVSARTILFDEVGALFAGMREDTYVPDAKLTNTIGEFIGIPEQDKEFGDGTVLVSGCRPHSCIEKGAAIVDRGARSLLAVALIHYECHSVLLRREAADRYVDRKHASGPSECEMGELLVYVIRRTTSREALIRELEQVERLRAWATVKSARLHEVFGRGIERERIKILVRPEGWDREE